LDAKVRWPNDVVVDGRKVAGVLVERHKKVLVIGVGINANGSYSEYPMGLREAVGIIQEMVGEKVNRNRLFAEIMNIMERRWFRLSEDYISLLVDDWNAVCYGLGEKVVILTRAEELVEGILVGLDGRTGGLRVRLEGGKEETVFSSDNVYYVKC
jgi:BirA family biotin operon repressor/biotin-[acetyl-CoA-carboxylase] ligase